MMTIFKKIDDYFYRVTCYSRIRELEKERDLLQALKDRNMSIDDGLAVLNKLIKEERRGTVNILA